MKKICAVLLCLILSAGLAGCRQTDASDEAVVPVTPEGDMSSQEAEAEVDVIDPFEEAAKISTQPQSDDTSLSSEEDSSEDSSAPPEQEPQSQAQQEESAPHLESYAEDVPLTPDPGEEESPAAASAAEGVVTTYSLDPQAIEKELFDLLNAERSINGVPLLSLDESLQWAARIRAPEILQHLSHTRPDDTPYYTAMDEAGFVYAGKWHGENAVNISFIDGLYDSQAVALRLFEALSESSGHYRNMISENFVQVGVGVHVEMEDRTISVGAVQMFAGE